MNESRMLRRIKAEAHRETVLRVLRVRFRAEPPAALASALEAVNDIARLEALLELAATCTTLDEFRAGLSIGQIA